MNTVLINVKGKNIENFIYKLHNKKIELLKIKYINRREIEIEIYYKDINLVNNIKGIYEINITRYKGIKRVKNLIKYHRFLIISIFIGIIVLVILTNIIYDIEIIYSGSKLRESLSYELKKYGITKYSFSKKYDELEHIKNNILIDMKDELEWLTIKKDGTKYIVTLEPRKINNISNDNNIYNVVAKKDAIIKKIIASSGDVLKNTNDYVKKGDVIVSSNIMLYDNLKNRVSAKATIYGEAWYKVHMEYPLNYYEEVETGNKKVIYNIKFMDRYIGLNGFKNKKIEDIEIIKNDIIPISINKQIQREIKIISYNMDYGEALSKAHIYARKKITDRLGENEYIIDEKDLKYELKDSKIVLDMFYTVYENIGEEVGDINAIQ